MKHLKNIKFIIAAAVLITMQNACKAPAVTQIPRIKAAPESYNISTDTSNAATINWKDFYLDKYLLALIDTAIKNNPEALIALQEIEIARNKVRAKNGELFPNFSLGGGLGVEKVGRYTSQGAGDASTEITPGKEVPDVLSDFNVGLKTSWEVDIWGKIKSEKRAAFAKYLGTIEGRNFVKTNLVAEVANSYYELLASDNQLQIIKESIELQKNQLDILRVQKEAAVVTELAVKQFEAQVLNSQSLAFEVQQKITETENKINFLLGRFNQPIERDKAGFMNAIPNKINEGIPTQLLSNRPDIKQAMHELEASKWELKAAKRTFYPSLGLSSAFGVQAFKPSFLSKLPESILFSAVGDMVGPLINKQAIKAEFKTANANQIEALYDYQKSILNAYNEVATELSKINNLEKQYALKSKEVETLTSAIDISNDLFKAARANYLEVLTAQRDAMDAKMDLIEVKKQQLSSIANIYKALGGGWK